MYILPEINSDRLFRREQISFQLIVLRSAAKVCALVGKSRGCGLQYGNRTLLYFHEINILAVSVIATVNGSP